MALFGFGKKKDDAPRKAEKAERADGWINGGVYLMRRAILDGIPSDRPTSLESDVFPALARAGHLFAFPAPPPLLDMGTPDGLAAMTDYLRQHPP